MKRTELKIKDAREYLESLNRILTRDGFGDDLQAIRAAATQARQITMELDQLSGIVEVEKFGA